MKRYSIMVYSYGSDKETELCQCDSHPEAIAKAAGQKMMKISGPSGKKQVIARYGSVRIVDREQQGRKA